MLVYQRVAVAKKQIKKVTSYRKMGVVPKMPSFRDKKNACSKLFASPSWSLHLVFRWSVDQR